MTSYYEARRAARGDPTTENCVLVALKALRTLKQQTEQSQAWKWAHVARFWAIEAGIPEATIDIHPGAGQRDWPQTDRLREAL